MPVPFATHRAQIETILAAWGMPPENAARTADVLSWADLHGIDSHGVSMVPEYDKRRRGGRINIKAKPRITRETPISAVVDGDGGLGHVPALFAMTTAINKARESGIGAVAVRNSGHFGACGYYTKMAADAGLIGLATTSAAGVRVAPTGAAEARFGTDPLSFAAPSGDARRPFLLDMATTTVAFGKVRNKANEGLPVPPGWVLTRDGQPTTDPLETAERGGFLTPLGGTREGSSHKGYGLAAMVNILSSCLSGATLVTDPMHTKKPHGIDIGHFFMAIDPGLFRDPDEFRADVTTFCQSLRAVRPVDPARPVLVAGDPERLIAAQRGRDGIPVAPGLLAKVKAVAEGCGAKWLLG
jgi:LDH2 family malate/lactate/ureidoglycolate dehydrogenase